MFNTGVRLRTEKRRTSEIELPLLDGVELRGHSLDELGRELDHGQSWSGAKQGASQSSQEGSPARVARNHDAARAALPAPSRVGVPSSPLLPPSTTMKSLHQRLTLYAFQSLTGGCS